MESKQIKSALISVYYKDGLEDIVKALDAHGVTIYSTGGTYKFITDLGINAVTVESLTGYPSILGGRVKTLHPKVFGGILSRRDMFSDGEQLNEFEIPEIDLVIVDLYPFEQTVASGAANQDIIEKIDIGGISLIRAAAKNYKDVVIVPSVNAMPNSCNCTTNKKVPSRWNNAIVSPPTLLPSAATTTPPSSTTSTARNKSRRSNTAATTLCRSATARTPTKRVSLPATLRVLSPN